LSRHKIIKGDCLKKLKDIKDESVDLIFTDPPYNERYNYRNSGFKDFNNNYYDFLLSVLKECQRILKDKKGSIYVKHSSRQIDAIIPLLNKYFKYRNLIIWNNSSQSHPKKNYDSFYEPIYFYTKTDEYIFNKKSELREQPPGYWNTKGFKFVGLLNNIWSDIKMIPGGCVRKKEAELHGSLKCHPCQMPEKLAERAIKISSNENDIILDPFLGSGTTLVACEKLNRNGLGIEISKEYCKLSYQRLQKEVNQLKFGREKSIIEKIGF
jgi:site-specific DNA-methyltransferase (adenine-specific)